MAIGPLGATIYTNQNMGVAATKQASLQNRAEMQSVMVGAMAHEKDKELKEVHPTEETYKIDPKSEHKQERNAKDSDMKEKETLDVHVEKCEDDNTPKKFKLDITV